MRTQRTTTLLAIATIVALTTTQIAVADPCGMVPPPPPIEIMSGPTIERIGVQKTYVAFDRGVETMVLRPGFSGFVEEFGMLIPFPNVPTIRKVDDNIFAHIAAAVDPPEVIARVQRMQPRWGGRMKRAPSRSTAAPADEAEAPLGFDTVRVLKQEAVGMYEVAVLAAGSSKALKRWIDDHNFRYPKGMDEVVDDYVDSRWVFAAIKTKVGAKAGVNPVPGMRKANAKRPAGSKFTGFVQAMGFRFESKKLVVPMRLSVFNASGNSRNIVYALTRGAKKIDGLPESFVVRQLPGTKLLRNLRSLLPLRVVGGTKGDLSAWQLKTLPQRRDPTPHNGLAKELISSDLLAMRSGRLASPLEKKETALLNIGESLGLRGRVIDDLNRAAMKKERDQQGARALAALQGMTLTVLDGAFDRKVLAKQNLRFKSYRMAAAKNNRSTYDATRLGPGITVGGKLYLSAADVSSKTEEDPAVAVAVASTDSGNGGHGGAGTPVALAGLLLGLGLLALRRRDMRTAVAAFGIMLAASGAAFAESAITRQLAGDRGEDVAIRLANSGNEGLPQLLAAVFDGDNPVAQGRAIAGIAKIGSNQADTALAQIVANSKNSMLVRTWAAAGRIQGAGSFAELQALESLSRSYPATRRPWIKRYAAVVRSGSVEEMLSASSRVPELRAELAQVLQAAPTKDLLSAMLTSGTQQTRQMAASYLGTKGPEAGKRVARALRFDTAATKAPWSGGALYMPSFQWKQRDAKRVAGSLLRWMLWAENQGDSQTQRVAANNLQSGALASAAGYKVDRRLAHSSQYWIGVWASTYGVGELNSVLAAVEASRSAK